MNGELEVSEGLIVHLEFLGGVGCCTRCEGARRLGIVRPESKFWLNILRLIDIIPFDYLATGVLPWKKLGGRLATNLTF